MPFQSLAQERYLYANHPDVAKKFAAETSANIKLPERVNRMPNVPAGPDAQRKLAAMKTLVKQQ